jgi:lipopolysaccharide assembly outer membrane protein LptD (OstA)
MRKTLLLVACVIGSSVFASGQTPANQDHPLTIRVVPTAQTVTAQRIERTENTLSLRGSVVIVSEASTIKADEVDLRITPDHAVELDLRGNVHVTMNPR